MNKKSLTLPFIVTLIFSIVMIVCLFLPYATATESRAEILNSYPDVVVYEELDMTAKDVVDTSLFEYFKIYTTVGEEFFGNATFANFYAVFIVTIGVLSLLTVLFAILKKAIPTIVFSVLSLGVFYLQGWDYADRGVVPSDNYNFGIGYYLFFIASIVVLIGAIWLLVYKIKNKKQLKNVNTD